MQKFTSYALTALPTSGIDVNGIYFIKGTSETVFRIYIRRNDNSAWVSLGITNQISSVNGITTPNVQLELSLSTDGELTITGGNTSIDLDARFIKIGTSIPWSTITNTPTTLSGYGITDGARFADVVRIFGDQDIDGKKKFLLSPEVPVATLAPQAIRKSQLDSEVGGLQTQINNINGIITDGMRMPTGLDCSSNPLYPASERGDGYVVTVAGKIGGTAGIQVRVGAEIRCMETNAGGTHAAVGDKFYILESDLDQATETVVGFAKIATQALADGGTNDTDIMTPKKTNKVVSDAITSIGGGNNVKYIAQTLTTPQKTQARTNIGAADDASVVKLTGAQTVAGVKTFSSSPKIPNATANNEPVTLSQLGTVTDAKFVRYDNATQGLTTTQQTNARTNIDAASKDDVMWGAKDW